MGRLTTRHNEFQQFQFNYTAPGAGSGASCTPGTNNAKGAWSNLFFGSTVDTDTYGIWIAFYDLAVAGLSLATLADIGIDTAGGTNYRVLIPNLGLADARTVASMGQAGFYYYFPIFIPANASIGIRAQQNQSVAHSFDVDCMLLQRPSHPELLRVGTYVDAIGIDTVNSRGTVFTPGVGSAWGAWGSLGTAPRDGFFVQFGAGIDAATRVANLYVYDYAIGDGTNFRKVYSAVYGGDDNSNNEFSLSCVTPEQCYATVKAGDTFYVRAAAKQTNVNANANAMAYVVGGG